jgi:mannose-6-phosphate isomerase-like protein (cupin superfamily)
MAIKEHDTLPVHRLPGIAHRTLAGARDGLDGLEVWMQTLDPGAETPAHRHDCDEVVVVTGGAGLCTIGAEEIAFAAASTLVIPAGAVHQVRNPGTEPLHLIAAFAATPVAARTAAGRPIPLPWA